MLGSTPGVAPSTPQESPRGLPLDPKSSLGELRKLRKLRKLKKLSWSELVPERVVSKVVVQVVLAAGEGRNFSLLLRLGCPGRSAAPLRPVGSFARSILRPFHLENAFSGKSDSGVGTGWEIEISAAWFGRRLGLMFSVGVRLVLPNRVVASSISLARDRPC